MGADDDVILIHIASPMAGRIVLDSTVVEHLRTDEFRLVLCTADSRVPDMFDDRDTNVGWARLYGRGLDSRPISRLKRFLARHMHRALVFRFGRMGSLEGSRLSLKMGSSARRRAQTAGLTTSRWIGMPLPSSRRIFDMLYRAYHSSWQRDRYVEDLFDRLKPRVLVLTHLQMRSVTPLVLAAAARRIPIVGMIGSWDQPTTAGPLVPLVDRYVAHNEYIKETLIRYHSIPAERINVVGWPQLDVSRSADLAARDELLERLGFTAKSKLILFGANAGWLGRHEGQVAIRLAHRLASNEYGEGTKLLIRCHPNDPSSAAAFGSLADSPHVRIEHANLRDLAYLATLMRHADVVMSTGGSIVLDAVAMDTPAIALGFAEGDVGHFDDPARLYEWEHNASVLASGGVWVARSFDELEQAVLAYLKDPSIHALGRQRLRASHLEPLDGRASERFARVILGVASTRYGVWPE